MNISNKNIFFITVGSLFLWSCYSHVEKKGVPVISFYVNGKILTCSIYDSEGDVITVISEIFYNGVKDFGTTAHYDKMLENKVIQNFNFTNFPTGKYLIKITAIDKKGNKVSNSYTY